MSDYTHKPDCAGWEDCRCFPDPEITRLTAALAASEAAREEAITGPSGLNVWRARAESREEDLTKRRLMAEDSLAAALRSAEQAGQRVKALETAGLAVCRQEVAVRENPYGAAEDFWKLWKLVADLRRLLSAAPGEESAPPVSPPGEENDRD